MTTIGIVEDDRLLNEALARMLEKKGYHPLRAYTLEEGMKFIRQKPELIILDINLPDGEGTRICKAAREYSRIPVLFLTARDEEEDMLRAFDLGADDYLVKPFSMAVLLKHVEAVLRRTQGEKEVFLYRGLTIDPERKQVVREGEEIRLTPREYALLDLLARNRGRVLTKTMILEQIWDNQGAFVEENTVNVTLNRLKKKIEPDPENPVLYSAWAILLEIRRCFSFRTEKKWRPYRRPWKN